MLRDEDRSSCMTTPFCLGGQKHASGLLPGRTGNSNGKLRVSKGSLWHKADELILATEVSFRR
jgi:hypothetical protein